MNFKVAGSLIAIALWVFIAFFSENRKSHTAKAESLPSLNARPLEKNILNHRGQKPLEQPEHQVRLPSAVEQPNSVQTEVRDSKLKEFLRSRTNQNWTFEKNNGHIEKIFGGEVKKLVNTDEKLKQFISELSSEMGYENLNFAEHKPAQKKSDHETINEFRQNIDDIEVYGAYFRAFRDNEALSATYFINEFKKYEDFSNLENFSRNELEAKVELYYERLGRTLKSRNCSNKVYFVGEKLTAELAYRCLVKTAAALPETYEVIVSTASADVLFQKRITIFN